MQTTRKQLVRGNLDAILLAALERQPSHGYGLIQLIRRKYQYYLGPSTIYPALNSFEKKGFVKGAWLLANDGRPRKNYTITKEGQKILEDIRLNLETIVGDVFNDSFLV